MAIGIGSFFLLAATACPVGQVGAAGLRAAHERARTAHLEGDAMLLTRGMADSAIMVSNGNVTTTTRAQTAEFFADYFSRVRYREWADVAPPQVHVSPDGQMGWMAVQIRARYSELAKAAAGEQTFRSSWIATYRLVGCDWLMTGNASAVVNK